MCRLSGVFLPLIHLVSLSLPQLGAAGFIFRPHPHTTAKHASSTVPACAIASSSWAAQKVSGSSGKLRRSQRGHIGDALTRCSLQKVVPTVVAEIVHACLESVPLGKAAAIELVEAIEPYLEWQSDAAYKASPSPDYFFPPYDMFAVLGQIKNDLKADNYAGELQFQEDLYLKVFSAGHDGHFAFFPDALTRVF